jgi:regulator of RNase E activity RraA
LAFAIAILAGLVIFGGRRSIARFAELVVPLMAGLYVLMARHAAHPAGNEKLHRRGRDLLHRHSVFRLYLD